MYTRRDIECGAGLLTGGEHTLVWQRGSEDVFDTSERHAIPRPGWHLAGGGRWAGGESSLDWCDLR